MAPQQKDKNPMPRQACADYRDATRDGLSCERMNTGNNDREPVAERLLMYTLGCAVIDSSSGRIGLVGSALYFTITTALLSSGVFGTAFTDRDAFNTTTIAPEKCSQHDMVWVCCLKIFVLCFSAFSQ